MTEQNQMASMPVTEISPAKGMRRAYTRCGLAIFALSLFLFLFVPVLVFVLQLLEQNGINAYTFFQDYLLFFNEALIMLGFLVGGIFLLGLPKAVPERHPVSFKLFGVIFLFSIAFGTVGDVVGSFWSSVLSSFTSAETSNTLDEALTATDIWQTVICVGILAPIIEEFFFRKLLLDRLHSHSEPIAILTSGIFFALFHGNLYQFFYTLAFGLLLAYMYCKTGSFLSVVLMHMAFNIFSGIIPLLLTLNLDSVSLTPEGSAQAATFLETLYEITSSLLVLLYTFIRSGLTVLGIVFFFCFAKRAKFKKTPALLSPEERVKASLLNVGIIAAFSVNVFTLLLSIF